MLLVFRASPASHGRKPH